MYDLGVDGRAWSGRQIAVGASAVTDVIQSIADVQIRKQIVRVTEIPFETCIEMSAVRAVEGGLLAEISQPIENGDRANRIIQRIVRRAPRIARDQWEQIRIVVNRIDHVEPVRTGHRRTVNSWIVIISLVDAMNRAAEPNRVCDFV